MLKKNITVFLSFFLIICFNCQQNENPKNICRDCGSFDVSKISFDENVDVLVSKTQVSITAFTDGFIEKKQDAISKSDKILAYKIKIRNPLNENFGEGFFKFSNVFKFDNLSFLVDSQKNLISYKVYTIYNGDSKKINNIINDIDRLIGMKHSINTLYADESEIYQWKSKKYFYQVMKNQKSKNSFYVSLLVIKNNRFNDSVKKAIKNDETFLLFNENSFKNDK
ncbi:hypothetical protein [Kaistella carnis]|uniref:Uncharacterized protein n=1 Tax=Kaistella carnis TaxID=1241979 RepID=A0A3G8XN69_9FLAO|nr:hypothetical protein [Kaistella carnis]AZI34328.1 hypothetical protein EIB73_14585 [Kaistella carnis]